jgi:ribonucleotide monophosphatase NagD (HAD superfamily)
MDLNLNLHHFHDVAQKYSNFVFDCDGVLWHGSKPIKGAIQTLFEILIDPKNQVFLVSNNATLNRKDFYKKVIDMFNKELTEDQQVQATRNFKVENCYNAGFVLAHEVANEIPLNSKIIVHAT